MKLQNLLIDQSVGAVLVHNIVGADGRQVLSIGDCLAVADVDELRAPGIATVGQCARTTQSRLGPTRA